MRLFLASQDFGNHADRLSEMVGENRKSLVVFNARDYKDDKGIAKQRELFAQNNLDFQELDLRDYFGKSGELRSFIDEYQPGLIVLLGGNTFLLRRALSQSGLDEILQQDIVANRYVLAGHSAGAIVAGPSLEGFERMDKEKLVMPGYQEEVIWSGLGLADARAIPHIESSEYDTAIVELRQELFDKNGWRYVMLRDSDVLVVDGEEEEVLQ